MNKSAYLGFSILDLCKTVMYDFWYNHRKSNMVKGQLCQMDTDSFTAHIKMEAICKDISEDVEKRFNTSNYEESRLLPKGKNKKVLGLMKDELGWQIIKKFVGLHSKTYS